MFVDHAYVCGSCLPSGSRSATWLSGRASRARVSGRRFVTLCCILWYKILIFIELVKWQLGRDDMSRKFEAKHYLRNTFSDTYLNCS